MENIKFRGYSTGTGWVYGYLVKHFTHTGLKDKMRSIIICNNEMSDQKVIVEGTEGAFIGAKDKNLKEIYEGDILQYHFKGWGDPIGDTKELEVIEMNETGTVIFKDSCFWFTSLDGKFSNCGSFELSEEDRIGIEEYSFEIIGNIYENPELLK